MRFRFPNAQSEPVTAFDLWASTDSTPHLADDPGTAIGSGDAEVEVFLPTSSGTNRPAVIYCPGGGYGSIDDTLGQDICAWLATLGIVGILLRYRLPDATLNPTRIAGATCVADVMRLVRMTRSHNGPAAGWGVDANKVGIAGESAGGHLATVAATLYDSGNPSAPDSIDRFSSRPDFGLICYPFTYLSLAGVYGTAFIGGSPPVGSDTLYSTFYQVDASTPPCFVTWAEDDGTISPQNSSDFIAQLISSGVTDSDEIHFATGGHGFGFPDQTNWGPWKTAAAAWLTALGFV